MVTRIECRQRSGQSANWRERHYKRWRSDRRTWRHGRRELGQQGWCLSPNLRPNCASFASTRFVCPWCMWPPRPRHPPRWTLAPSWSVGSHSSWTGSPPSSHTQPWSYNISILYPLMSMILQCLTHLKCAALIWSFYKVNSVGYIYIPFTNAMGITKLINF